MKTAVIKISGKTINNFLSTDEWINTINNLYEFYDGLVIVHGAGKHITEWGEKLGFKSEFIDGQRVTSKDYMEVVAAVQAGLVNSQIKSKLNSSGLKSAGFSGIDLNLFTAKNMNEDLGFVGVPHYGSSIEMIEELISKKIIPVFSSVCSDADGNLMNVNADIFTEALAAVLKADTVFFISDVSGVIINNSVVNSISPAGIDEGISSGFITDGMIPKLLSASLLLNKGINKIWIGSNLTLDNDQISNGTWIVSDAEQNLLSVA